MTRMFVNYFPHYAIIAEASKLNPNPTGDKCISFGPENGKEVYCGAVFQDWSGNAILVHSAIFEPRYMTRGVLWHVFYYPFVQLGCERVFCSVPSTNEKALALNRKFGFKDITRVPKAFPDGDCVIQGMEREECRWLARQPKEIFEPVKVA